MCLQLLFNRNRRGEVQAECKRHQAYKKDAALALGGYGIAAKSESEARSIAVAIAIIWIRIPSSKVPVCQCTAQCQFRVREFGGSLGLNQISI